MWTKSQILVFVFGGWVLTVLAVLTVFRALDPTFFFLLCLLGFLIIFDLSRPFTVKPKWKSRVGILTILGLAIFTVVALLKIVDIFLP